MYNLFEKPWTLLIVAAAALVAVFIFRALRPEKRSWPQFLIPVFIVVLAFGVDLFVVTDLEKIDRVLKSCIDASVNEKPDVIDAFIASDYSDSLRLGKTELMIYLEAILSELAIERFVTLDQTVELSGSEARVILKGFLFFDENSPVSKELKPVMAITLELGLRKYPAALWQINRAEVLEIDKQPVRWKNIQSVPKM
jgi:hypothetical protein